MYIFSTSREIVLGWVPQNPIGDTSTWVQWWLFALRQITITRANVNPNLCRHIATLGHNVLNDMFLIIAIFVQDSDVE